MPLRSRFFAAASCVAILTLLAATGTATAQTCVTSIAPAPLAPSPGGVTPPSLLPIQALGIGDFNGDGRGDIASVDTTAATLDVRLSLPNGTFAPPVSTAPGGTMFRNQTFFADVDGDGILDALVTTSNAGVTSRAVWYGHSNGTFTFGFETAMNLGVALVTDLNRDGRPDLIGFAVNASGTTTNELRAWINQGNRSFTSVSLATFSIIGFPLVHDLDGDGRLDLFIVRLFSPNSSAQAAYQAPPTQSGPGVLGAFVPEPSMSIGAVAGSQVFLTDTDGDGRLDIVVPSTTAFMTVCPGLVASGRTLLFGAPVSVDPFATNTFSGTAIEAKATLADLNGDGRPDLVRQMLFAGQSHIVVGVKFASAGSSAAPDSNVFGPELDFAGVNLANQPPQGFGPHVAPAVADLTGDGLPEILVVGPDFVDSAPALPAVALTISRPGGVVLDAAPSPVRTRAGQAATLSVAAHATTAATPLGFRWRKDGVALVESAHALGTGTPTLTLSGTSPSDSGVYTVDVFTACDTTSASTYLDVGNTGRDCVADVDDGSGTGTPDGGVTIDDLLFFLTHFEAGC